MTLSGKFALRAKKTLNIDEMKSFIIRCKLNDDQIKATEQIFIYFVKCPIVAHPLNPSVPEYRLLIKD